MNDDPPHPAGSRPTPGTGWGGHDPQGVDAPGHAFRTPEDRRYREDRPLGEGGMGRVHAAWDHRLRRMVAVKVAAEGTAAEARLSQEAWIAAQLDHPGIVPVHDAGVTPEGRRYVVMRLIRGRTLRRLLDDAPAPRLDLLPALRRACEAVAYAHDAGIVHRDLSPANVLVGDAGEVQVVDWGLARPISGDGDARWSERVLPREDAARTVAGVVLGTPGYMSPEQAVGAPVDPRADVWSLGAILHELLTGHPPFAELDEQERQRAIAIRDVPSLRSSDPTVSSDLADLVARALARAPAQRPADAGAFLAALVSATEGSPRPRSRATPAFLLIALAATAMVAVWMTSDLGRSAPADLATEILTLRADRALSRGRLPEAERLAIDALAEAETPAMRGLLARLRAGGSATREAGRLRPADCAHAVLGPDGSDLVCVGTGEISRHDLDGSRRWTRAFATPIRDLVVAEDEVVVIHDDNRVATLDRASGSTVGPLLSRRWAVWSGDQGAQVWLWTEVGLYRAGTPLDADDALVPAPVAARRLSVVDLPDGTLVAASDHEVWWHPPGGDWRAAGTWRGGGPRDAVRHLRAVGNAVLLVSHAGIASRWQVGSPIADAAPVDLGLAVVDLDVAPGGERAAVVDDRGLASVIDLTTGALLLRLPSMPNGGAPRMVDDHRVRLVGDRVWTWTLPDTTPWPRVLRTPSDGVVALDVRRDVLAWSGPGMAEIRDAEGRIRWSRREAGGVFKAIALSPDGTRAVVAGGNVGPPTVVDVATGEARPLDVPPPSHRRAIWLDDDRVAAASYARGGPWVVHLPSGRLDDTLTLPRLAFTDLVSSKVPGSAWGLEDALRLVHVSVADGRTTVRGPVPPSTAGLAVGPVSDPWVILDRAVARLDPQTAAVRERVPVEADVSQLLILEGGRIATGHTDGTLRVRDRDGTLRLEARAHTRRLAALAADGDTLLTGSWDGTVRSWALDVVDATVGHLRRDADARWGPSPSSR